MRAFVRERVSARAPGSEHYFGIADALRQPDVALASLRRFLEINRQSMDFTRYWELWTMPYSTIRAQPGFKELMREAGIVDYWRASGKWGDFCKPVGDDDFECR
jgi:hypothetical protein